MRVESVDPAGLRPPVAVLGLHKAFVLRVRDQVRQLRWQVLQFHSTKLNCKGDLEGNQTQNGEKSGEFSNSKWCYTVCSYAENKVTTKIFDDTEFSRIYHRRTLARKVFSWWNSLEWIASPGIMMFVQSDPPTTLWPYSWPSSWKGWIWFCFY